MTHRPLMLMDAPFKEGVTCASLRRQLLILRGLVTVARVVPTPRNRRQGRWVLEAVTARIATMSTAEVDAALNRIAGGDTLLLTAAIEFAPTQGETT